MAKVQNRSITEKITWAGKAQAGFHHTCCLAHHPPCLLPTQQKGALWSVRPSFCSAKVMANANQEETQKRDIPFWQKSLSQQTDPVSEQVRKTKKCSFISQFGLEMEDESKLWNHLTRQERAGGNISSMACFLLSAIALSCIVSFSMCHCSVQSRGDEVEVRVCEENAWGYLHWMAATWQETWLWEEAGSSMMCSHKCVALLGSSRLPGLPVHKAWSCRSWKTSFFIPWVSVRSEANHPETNTQTCLQAEEWKAAFLHLLGFSFTFHELRL